MMRRILLAGLFLLFVLNSNAQRLIPRIGYSKSTISFGKGVTTKMDKNGYYGGLGLEFKLINHLYFQPELGFSQKGSNFRTSSTEHELTLNYLEFSVPIKFSFGFNKANFHLMAGPTFGYGIGGRYKYTLDGYGNSAKVFYMPYSIYEDSYRYFADVDKRIDKGLMVGFGMEFFNRVIVDFRYQKSISRLYTLKNRSDYNNEELMGAKNNLWQISLGVPINLFKKRLDSDEPLLAKSRFMPTGGVTFSTISLRGKDIEKYWRLGYSLGVAYRIEFNHNLFFAPEVRFIQKGMDFFDREYKQQLSLYYLESVLPVKFGFGNEAYRLYAHLGPTFGLGVDGRYNIVSYYENSVNVRFKHLPVGSSKQYYYAFVDNRFEFGYQAGFGLEIFKSLAVELSYLQGFTELYSDKNRTQFDNYSIGNAKNSTWLFKVGIPLKSYKRRADHETSRLIVSAGTTKMNMTYQFLQPSSRQGFSLGVGYEMEIFKNLFLQPELNFVQKGAKWSFDKGDNHEMVIYYLEVPLFAKYTLGFGKIKTSLLGGPFFGIGLGGHYKAQYGGKTDNLSIKFKPYHMSDNYNEKYSYVDRQVEFGVSVGVGFELYNKVLVSFRYAMGLSSIYTDWNRNFIGDSDILKDVRNQGYILSIGVPIKVGN